MWVSEETGGRAADRRNPPPTPASAPDASGTARYGYIGSMKTLPGRREEVVAILLRCAGGLRDVGCVQYTVGVSRDDDVTIWASEVWTTEEGHAASLELPEVRGAISRVMPMIAGEFTRVEVDVRGGLGL